MRGEFVGFLRQRRSLYVASLYPRILSGLTESSPISHVAHPESIVPGSVGQLLPNMRAKIVDEHGVALPMLTPTSVGEICL